VGFFAEHKLEFPAPECGEDVCLHGSLGVLGNLMTGTACTMVMFGMNTPLDPEEIERPPLNLVLAIDTSGSMGGDAIKSVRVGLQLMLAHLQPQDRISLVTYSDTAQVVFEDLGVDENDAMATMISELEAGGATNIYEGLYLALDTVAQHAAPDRQNRVILLSDGIATKGITSEAKIVKLAETYASQGVGISAIGVGEQFDVSLMRAIGEKGAGNFYFLDDVDAVTEVFTDEVNAFLVPIALDIRIHFGVGPGYVVRDAYGTSGWQPMEHGGSIEIPALFLAGRTDDTEPATEGRRGGGGAILVEVMPVATEVDEGDIHDVGNITVTWIDPATGGLMGESFVPPEGGTGGPTEFTQNTIVTNPNVPGTWPEEGTFTDKTSEKGFVMLNLYVAFKMAAEAAESGNFDSASGILEAIRPNLVTWLEGTPDADIEDDLVYVDLFIDVLAKEQPVPIAPPEPWPMGD
jgi:Ca-activated chloride channel family protein